MGFFKKSTKELEDELEKAKKQKKLLDEKARLKDIEINKKIAEKEKREQLMFEVKRLKKKPKSQTELLLNKKRLNKAKTLTKSLGSGVGKALITFLQKVDEAYYKPEPKKKRRTKKKSKGKR